MSMTFVVEPDLPEQVPGFRPTQLEGFRIGVTSDRRSKDLIEALERRGAYVLHAPTLRIAHAERDEPLIEDTRRVIAAAPDVLLATTSYGIRRWFEVADAAGLGGELIRTLEATDILVRGPKARGAVRAAGLDDAGMSDKETTASLVDAVLADHPSASTVVVQLHGYPDEQQLQRLRDAGRTVLTVAPYRWTDPEGGDERTARLIDAICTRQLDCVTFTSAPAVEALFAAADATGHLSEVLAAMTSDVLAAAVGPVTAAPLVAVGVHPIQPERYRMGALIRLVCEHLEQHRVERVQTVHGMVELRGSIAVIDGARLRLPPSSLALLRTLVRAGGAVVTRGDLAAALPGQPDDHAVEVALSRLRQAIGSPRIVATVVKRGYRLAV
ncbi:uroporphyrinogen-III synthase [Rathayibacter sp. KR2-224]|uniref:uroporphyrinogen-III synthase n=1 Tax=Rathayibacter sp. KR2-224 TaxID=3400913 RepID=UPI003C0FAA0C